MREIFDESYPFKTPKKGKTPWWNSDLTKQERTTRVLLNRALKSDSAASWNRYKEAQRVQKKDIRSVKRSSWRGFSEETNSLVATSKLKRILVKNVARSWFIYVYRAGDTQEAIKRLQSIYSKCL